MEAAARPVVAASDAPPLAQLPASSSSHSRLAAQMLPQPRPESSEARPQAAAPGPVAAAAASSSATDGVQIAAPVAASPPIGRVAPGRVDAPLHAHTVEGVGRRAPPATATAAASSISKAVQEATPILPHKLLLHASRAGRQGPSKSAPVAARATFVPNQPSKQCNTPPGKSVGVARLATRLAHRLQPSMLTARPTSSNHAGTSRGSWSLRNLEEAAHSAETARSPTRSARGRTRT